MNSLACVNERKFCLRVECSLSDSGYYFFFGNSRMKPTSPLISSPESLSL
jgi:hypothetical protein